jgi:hypothetical protein
MLRKPEVAAIKQGTDATLGAASAARAAAAAVAGR